MSSDGDLHGARSYLYQLLQSLFGVEPSEGQLAVVAQGETAAACEAVGGESLRAVGERLAKAALEAALEDLHCTYNRLVVGPGSLLAPPWESVYTSHGRLVMQPSTLEVRSAYHKCGFEPALCRRVPDDHVALELDFMAALAKEALEARQRADAKGARDALAASAQFLQEHLGVWVQEFADALRGKGRAPRYAPVACALAAFVASDAERLAGAGGKA